MRLTTSPGRRVNGVKVRLHELIPPAAPDETHDYNQNPEFNNTPAHVGYS